MTAKSLSLSLSISSSVSSRESTTTVPFPLGDRRPIWAWAAPRWTGWPFPAASPWSWSPRRSPGSVQPWQRVYCQIVRFVQATRKELLIGRHKSIFDLICFIVYMTDVRDSTNWNERDIEHDSVLAPPGQLWSQMMYGCWESGRRLWKLTDQKVNGNVPFPWWKQQFSTMNGNFKISL